MSDERLRRLERQLLLGDESVALAYHNELVRCNATETEPSISSDVMVIWCDFETKHLKRVKHHIKAARRRRARDTNGSLFCSNCGERCEFYNCPLYLEDPFMFQTCNQAGNRGTQRKAHRLEAIRILAPRMMRRKWCRTRI